MTAESVLEVLEAAATIFPPVAEALRRLLEGHPTAKRVRDILGERGQSELVAEELRAEGEAP